MSDDDPVYRAFAESIAPRRDLWPATWARIRRQRQRVIAWRSAVAASIAAAIAIAVLVRTPAPPPIPNAAVQRAEQAYLDAFALLHAELKTARIPVDPAAMEQMDTSIANARRAVVAASQDARAVARWREACDRKVELLRKAVESQS
jgi:hypothetical protein